MKGYFTKQVDNAVDGLLKVSKEKFALFISEHTARRDILSVIPYDYRCGIRELPIKQTTTSISFPMPINSPYKELISIA